MRIQNQAIKTSPMQALRGILTEVTLEEVECIALSVLDISLLLLCERYFTALQQRHVRRDTVYGPCADEIGVKPIAEQRGGVGPLHSYPGVGGGAGVPASGDSVGPPLGAIGAMGTRAHSARRRGKPIPCFISFICV